VSLAGGGEIVEIGLIHDTDIVQYQRHDPLRTRAQPMRRPPRHNTLAVPGRGA
jgi:hypothetical protein